MATTTTLQIDAILGDAFDASNLFADGVASGNVYGSRDEYGPTYEVEDLMVVGQVVLDEAVAFVGHYLHVEIVDTGIRAAAVQALIVQAEIDATDY